MICVESPVILAGDKLSVCFLWVVLHPPKTQRQLVSGYCNATPQKLAQKLYAMIFSPLCFLFTGAAIIYYCYYSSKIIRHLVCLLTAWDSCVASVSPLCVCCAAVLLSACVCCVVDGASGIVCLCLVSLTSGR